MARSRYANVPTISGRYFATNVDAVRKNFLGPSILDGVPTIDHVINSGERLDNLAARYYGEDQYWWVIALANRIGFALSIEPGTILKIPLNVDSIISKIQR